MNDGTNPMECANNTSQYTNHWTHRLSSYTPHIVNGDSPYIRYEQDITPSPRPQAQKTHEQTSVTTLINCHNGDTNNAQWSPTYMNTSDFNLVTNKLGLHTNEAAFKCLNTQILVPGEVKIILSFGPKFSVPMPFDDTKQKLLLYGIHRLNKFHMSVYEQRAITQMAKEHIQRTKNSQNFHAYPNDIRKFLVHCYNCVIKFFSDNPDHVIAQADKGNISIVMKRNEYIDKVEEHLADKNTYTEIKSPSHSGYTKRNEVLLKKMADLQVIARNRIPSILTNEDKIPNMYGLIKLHKESQPIRPVVNTRSGPGYTLARLLTNIFTATQETHKYNVKNSMDVMERLSHITPDIDEYFASYDIKSMFTNITTDMAIASIMKRHQNGKIRTRIPLALIIETTKFVTRYATEIEFNDRLYKQIRGLKMGSSLSSILADMVTEDILDQTFIHIERPKLFTKYVDDCLILARKNLIREVGNKLNSAYDHIIFETEEESDDGHLAYLDIDIHNTHHFELFTRWHQKPMASGRILNFRSSHPKPTIINTAKCYIFNILCITHPKFHDEVLPKIIELLTLSNYPTKMTNTIISDAHDKWKERQINFSTQHQEEQCNENDPYEFGDIEKIEDERVHGTHTKNTKRKARTYTSIPFFPEITPLVQRDILSIKHTLIATGTPMSTMKPMYDRHKKLRIETNEENNTGRRKNRPTRNGSARNKRHEKHMAGKRPIANDQSQENPLQNTMEVATSQIDSVKRPEHRHNPFRRTQNNKNREN